MPTGRSEEVEMKTPEPAKERKEATFIVAGRDAPPDDDYVRVADYRIPDPTAFFSKDFQGLELLIRWLCRNLGLPSTLKTLQEVLSAVEKLRFSGTVPDGTVELERELEAVIAALNGANPVPGAHAAVEKAALAYKALEAAKMGILKSEATVRTARIRASLFQSSSEEFAYPGAPPLPASFDLAEYQRRAAELSTFHEKRGANFVEEITNVALGLAGELGEASELEACFIEEIGDFLWYLFEGATAIGGSLHRSDFYASAYEKLDVVDLGKILLSNVSKICDDVKKLRMFSVPLEIRDLSDRIVRILKLVELICADKGLSLEAVAYYNIMKLETRYKERLHGKDR